MRTSALRSSPPDSGFGCKRMKRSSLQKWPLRVLVLITQTPVLWAQLGDARAGAEVLRDRQCVICHSVAGQGGKIAPDLARRSLQPYTPAALAAQMWNHGPRMWRAMEERNLEVPNLAAGEVMDLYAYFRSLRYFDPPGDAARGKGVFLSRQCFRCHAIISAKEQSRGPSVLDWPSLKDPVLWVQNMWNHAAKMAPEMEAEGIAWPQFQVQEMVDLLVYLRNLPSLPSREFSLHFGIPAAGELVFEDHGCIQCHRLGEGDSGKVDLLPATGGSPTLTMLAVEMWNHRPQMAAAARRKGLEIKSFAGEQMRDLLSYLLVKGFFEATGKPNRGADLFREKQCLTCHEGGTDAPQLPRPGAKLTAADFAAAVWRHGPEMLSVMSNQGISWPALSGRDVNDVTAFLSSR